MYIFIPNVIYFEEHSEKFLFKVRSILCFIQHLCDSNGFKGTFFFLCCHSTEVSNFSKKCKPGFDKVKAPTDGPQLEMY